VLRAAQDERAGTADGADVSDVFLPPSYVLRDRHVIDALKGVPGHARNVTVWIHSSTLGIEEVCFALMQRVSRILVWDLVPDVPVRVDAAVLGMFIAKLRAYEPALADIILGFVTHNDDEMHRVGDGAFRSCRTLKEVVLPRSITHVGIDAFYGCSSLTSVTLPDTLAHIGRGAFYECTSLTSLTLPDSLTHVGKDAFRRCTSLMSVTLPDSLTHVGDCAFCGCTRLASVTLPESLTHLGDCAFDRCTSLTLVMLPDSLLNVGKSAFPKTTSVQWI
jgi:hypothetical protein